MKDWFGDKKEREMKVEEYKSIRPRPDVFQRSFIESSANALAELRPLSLKLLAIVDGAAIAVPEPHDKNETSNFFRITLEAAEAPRIED